MPPGVPRSRSFTRFAMRVGLLHFGQSVLRCVSMTFLRSPVFAIFAIGYSLFGHSGATNKIVIRGSVLRLAADLARHQDGGSGFSPAQPYKHTTLAPATCLYEWVKAHVSRLEGPD